MIEREFERAWHPVIFENKTYLVRTFKCFDDRKVEIIVSTTPKPIVGTKDYLAYIAMVTWTRFPQSNVTSTYEFCCNLDKSCSYQKDPRDFIYEVDEKVRRHLWLQLHDWQVINEAIALDFGKATSINIPDSITIEKNDKNNSHISKILMELRRKE